MNKQFKRVYHTNIKKFDQVIYVPNHLNTPEQIANEANWGYGKGIEQGFITGWDASGAWVMFWRNRQNGGILPPEIRNKSAAEKCYLHNLYFFDTFAEIVIRDAYKEIRGENG